MAITRSSISIAMTVEGKESNVFVAKGIALGDAMVASSGATGVVIRFDTNKGPIYVVGPEEMIPTLRDGLNQYLDPKRAN